MRVAVPVLVLGEPVAWRFADRARAPGAGVSGGQRRVFLPAVVPPEAAYVITRDFGVALEAKAQAVSAANPELARQLWLAVASMRESARQRFAGGGSAVQAGSGNAEVPCEVDRSGSGRGPSVVVGLTTGEVAVKLRVTRRQVLNLIEGKRLTATWRGRGWVIDEVSVAMELDRRGERWT